MHPSPQRQRGGHRPTLIWFLFPSIVCFSLATNSWFLFLKDSIASFSSADLEHDYMSGSQTLRNHIPIEKLEHTTSREIIPRILDNSSSKLATVSIKKKLELSSISATTDKPKLDKKRRLTSVRTGAHSKANARKIRRLKPRIKPAKNKWTLDQRKKSSRANRVDQSVETSAVNVFVNRTSTVQTPKDTTTMKVPSIKASSETSKKKSTNGKTEETSNIHSVKNNRDVVQKEKKPHVGSSGAKSNNNGFVVTEELAALSPNATFSACLLIRDDNEILSEWIAYHYHVLRLRDIVVAVDPNSQTSPSSILSRWKDRMNIEEWSDESFMPQDFVQSGFIPESEVSSEAEKIGNKFRNMSIDEMGEIISHRYRQRVFLARCLQTLKKRGKTWAIHIDTDEFVTSSKLLRQMGPKFVTVPSIEEPGSVLSLLQHHVKHFSRTVGYPCVSVLRVLFGSVESSPEERNVGVPENFNSTRFETMRWQYHAPPHDKSQHGHGKVIMDISALPSYFFESASVFSIHRPLASLCRSHEELQYSSFMRHPITAAHYLGSWERYNAREDKRRSRQIYDLKANVQKGKDDGLKLWLKGFIEDVGMESAVTLLGSDYLVRETLVAS